MASKCLQSVLACGMRATLLDSNGNVADQPNNYWVTDGLIEVGVAPDISAGPDFEMRSGCSNIIGSFRGPDLLKRFTLNITLGDWAFGLLSLMLGYEVITEGSDVIGFLGGDQANCGQAPPKVAFEFWSQANDCDHQDETFPWIHWLFPSSQWQIGDLTFNESDFARVALTGVTFSNPLWGAGPYDDDPGVIVGDGPWAAWLSETGAPEDTCSFGSVAPSSGV